MDDLKLPPLPAEDPRYVVLRALEDAVYNYRDLWELLADVEQRDLDLIRDDLLAAVNGLALLLRQVAGELSNRPDLLEPYLLLTEVTHSTLLIAQAQSIAYLKTLPLLPLARVEERVARLSY